MSELKIPNVLRQRSSIYGDTLNVETPSQQRSISEARSSNKSPDRRPQADSSILKSPRAIHDKGITIFRKKNSLS